MRSRLAVLIAAAFTLFACDDSADRPYLRFAGGGFIFNYNLAQAYYGFVALRERTLPDGSVLEAEFEDPGGGDPIVVRQSTSAARSEYSFRTPPLQGVEKGRPYVVKLRVLEKVDGKVLAQYAHTFTSTLDQDILPVKPLTIGPGYQPNPQSPYGTASPPTADH